MAPTAIFTTDGTGRSLPAPAGPRASAMTSLRPHLSNTAIVSALSAPTPSYVFSLKSMVSVLPA